MLINREEMIEIVKDDLTAGIVNLELDDDVISRNIDRALRKSTDYWSYTDYKTITPTAVARGSGYVLLTDIDDSVENAVPTIVRVFPTRNILPTDSALLGLGSLYIKAGMDINKQLMSYASMINRLSNIDSILGRNARVIGDKLWVAQYQGDITVEYIPNIVAIEHINEGSWVEWLIDYTVALCKIQLAQGRGKFKVGSNPSEINASTLLEEGNNKKSELEEELKQRGMVFAER